MFAQVKVFTEYVLPQGKDIPVAPIEQFAAKEFFNNDAGWTRNDIAVLAACTSKSQYDAIVQRLVERKADFNLKPDTKLIDAYKICTPRWCQSPLELQNFAEYAANLQLADAEKMYESMRPDDKQDEKVSESEATE